VLIVCNSLDKGGKINAISAAKEQGNLFIHNTTSGEIFELELPDYEPLDFHPHGISIAHHKRYIQISQV